MQPPLPEPLAFFLTWTTYGTWLPGDARGWVADGGGDVRPPDPVKERAARDRMKEPPLYLTPGQRRLVQRTIAEHCRIRGWSLHAVNARTNHVHAVLSASDVHPDRIREQFKAWCTRRMKEAIGPTSCRRRWWTEGGSGRYINDEQSLEAAIIYVRDAQ